MPYVLLSILLAVSGAALAQHRPQLTWQGYVRAGATLYIQADRVDIQGRGTGSVESPKIDMIEPLPSRAQSIRVKVRRGKGRVEVVEQPARDNEFTAAVQITPAGTRHEMYVIDFFWDTNPGAASAPNRGADRIGELSGSGRAANVPGHVLSFRVDALNRLQ